MKFMPGTVIIIPSRMAAKRLPGKPLLKLNNKTIITNVFKRAEKAGLGTVYVATEDEEIYQEVKKNGGNCVMTQKGHRSGSDRIFDAILNPEIYIPLLSFILILIISYFIKNKVFKNSN